MSSVLGDATREVFQVTYTNEKICNLFFVLRKNARLWLNKLCVAHEHECLMICSRQQTVIIMLEAHFCSQNSRQLSTWLIIVTALKRAMYNFESKSGETPIRSWLIRQWNDTFSSFTAKFKLHKCYTIWNVAFMFNGILSLAKFFNWQWRLWLRIENLKSIDTHKLFAISFIVNVTWHGEQANKLEALQVSRATININHLFSSTAPRQDMKEELLKVTQKVIDTNNKSTEEQP